MDQVIVNYLKYLGILVSEAYCKKAVLSHPDYSSLLSISDVLQRLGIPCQIGRIEERYLPKVEFPFLIQMENSGELVQITKRTDFEKNELDFLNSQCENFPLKFNYKFDDAY